MEPEYNQQPSLTVEGFNSFLSKVFFWMFIGLLTTAVTSLFVLSTPSILIPIATNNLLYLGLIFGELALVVVLSRNLMTYKTNTAIALFLLYAVLNGLTLSVILLLYTGAVVTNAFFITAALFGVMALYGYLTKTDLSPFRTFFTLAIVGIILATIANIFIASSGLDYVINLIGVVVFAGLTAYDIQKMKSYYAHGVQQGGAIEGNLAIVGALNLYLDFINMFLFVLRLLGRRR